MSDFIKIYEHRKKKERREFNELEVAMEWIQWQDSIDPIQLLHLKRLRNMAAEKIWCGTHTTFSYLTLQ